VRGVDRDWICVAPTLVINRLRIDAMFS
jgi:hypothetical protein